MFDPFARHAACPAGLRQLHFHGLSQFRGTYPGTDGLFRRGRLPRRLDDGSRVLGRRCRRDTWLVLDVA